MKTNKRKREFITLLLSWQREVSCLTSWLYLVNSVSQWLGIISCKWWMVLSFAIETKSVIGTWSLKTCFLMPNMIWKLQILALQGIYLVILETVCFQPDVELFLTWPLKFIFLKTILASLSTCLPLESFFLWWSPSTSHFQRLWKKITFTSASSKTGQTYFGRLWLLDMEAKMLLVRNSWIWSIACCKLIQFTDLPFTRSLHTIGVRVQPRLSRKS